MNPKTKIKVKVADLLAAVQAKQEQSNREYEDALSEYELKRGAYATEVVAYLTRLVAEELGTSEKKVNEIRAKSDERVNKLGTLIRQAQTDIDSLSLSSELGHCYDGSRPSAPYKPGKESYATAIRQLEMAADPTILISAEDFASYLR